MGSGAFNIQQGWEQIEAGGILDTIPVVGWIVAVPFEVIGTARVAYGWYNVWGGLIQSIDASQSSPAPPNYIPPIQIQLDPRPLYPGYEPVINVTPAVGPAIF